MCSISPALSVEPSDPVLVRARFELLRALALDLVELANSAWELGLVVRLASLEPRQACITTMRASS